MCGCSAAAARGPTQVRARADRRRLSNVIAALIQAGNTPLHNAAYEGKIEVAQVLLQMGADVNALNNAGDRPWHWANNMDNEAMMAFLEKNGANKDQGRVLLQDHVPKTKGESGRRARERRRASAAGAPTTLVRGRLMCAHRCPSAPARARPSIPPSISRVPFATDFYENYPEHPPPHPEYLEWREEEDRKYEQEKHKLIPGM